MSQHKYYYYTYITTNNLNGFQYIGSHSSKTLHNPYLGSGKALLEAMKEDGRQNFSKQILAIYENREDAYQAESQLLSDKWMNGNVYNKYKTTSGLISHSEETKKRISEKKSGENNPNFGKPSPLKGRERKAITKIIISQTMTGRKKVERDIIHVESGTIYSTIKEAAEAHGIKYVNLKQQLLRGSISCQFAYHYSDKGPAQDEQ